MVTISSEPKLTNFNDNFPFKDREWINVTEAKDKYEKYKKGNKENSFLIITHYQRLLDYIKPDFVHVLMNGKIIKSGGPELAKELDLDVLVEIHSKDELNKVCIDSVDIIGVNNRNLKDFSVNVENSIEIGKEIPESFVKISESGLYKFEELKRLIDFGYDGFLIGELFMREIDPGYKLGNLINQIKGES